MCLHWVAIKHLICLQKTVKDELCQIFLSVLQFSLVLIWRGNQRGKIGSRKVQNRDEESGLTSNMDILHVFHMRYRSFSNRKTSRVGRWQELEQLFQGWPEFVSRNPKKKKFKEKHESIQPNFDFFIFQIFIVKLECL